METNAFSSLGVSSLQSSYSLFSTACCPDKDLVVLVSRVGTKDRLSLWKVQGIRIWEVQVGSNIKGIVGLAWSPDGQTIAVAHDPPQLTLHSMQDGRQERALQLVIPDNSQTRLSQHITHISWFQEESAPHRPPADVFRRNSVITGSAHSLLQMLPLLDHFQEHTHPPNAMDLFAFQGVQTRHTTKQLVPDFIQDWPTLELDPLSSSMSSYTPGVGSRTSQPSDHSSDNSGGSILIATDATGSLFLFLDGSYPLGRISLNNGPHRSLFHHPPKAVFSSHAVSEAENHVSTCMRPTVLAIALLDDRRVRDIAKSSTSARRLVWYAWRLVKDMRSAWFGSESMSGARELGPRWIRALETKQTTDFGEKEPTAVLDLTRLLLTGRSTDALSDLLGSGEQMSERVLHWCAWSDSRLNVQFQGIQKWETTVTEALIKLRDFTEKRIVPAFQRLHLILEEVKGWSLLHQYAAFEFSNDEVDACCQLCARGIVVASWLASIARRELHRFVEFIAWLRHAVSTVNPSNDGNPTPPRFDVLEVNSYFISGLQVSPIDKWFIGPAPRFAPEDLGISNQQRPLQEVLERAKKVAKQGKRKDGRKAVVPKDLSHIDRNLDALVQELATRCQRLFAHAAGAVSRSASISPGQSTTTRQPRVSHSEIRIRVIPHEQGYVQFFAAASNVDGRSCLCLVRVPYEIATSQQAARVEVSIREFVLPEGSEEDPQVDLQGVDFFDDESVVIVYQLPDKSGSTFIATASYIELGYELIQPEGDVNMPAQEDVILGAIEAWKAGQLQPTRQAVTRRRRLNMPDSGKVTVAVNGRVGRRVACVLNEQGTIMEALDLEGDGEDIEGDGEESG